MKVNKPLIKKIIKAIREHHDQFQMSDWFSDTLDIEDDSQEPALAGGCGTAGCIAGWAIFLSKRYRTLAEARDENAQGDPLKLAARILGLRQTTEYGTIHKDASRLFFVNNWPEEFREAYRNASTTEEMADVAARRLEHFLKHNE